MESTTPLCPKCGQPMEEGFVVDFGDNSVNYASSWIKGVPTSGWWFGVKAKGKERRKIKTLRCVDCGFLESYAAELYEE